MLSPLSNNARLLLGAALVVAVLFAPPYVAGVIGVILALRWRAWEVIVAGVFMDFLWMPQSFSFSSFDSVPVLTIISIALVFGLEPLRRQLLLGSD